MKGRGPGKVSAACPRAPTSPLVATTGSMLATMTSMVADGMLANKVVIVTGASPGVGEATAFGFARAGVAWFSRAWRTALVEAHARSIREGGCEAIGVGVNVTEEGSVAPSYGEVSGQRTL